MDPHDSLITQKRSASPAFQFYPKDWLTSQAISSMTPEQEGAYIRLLCLDWEWNGLPNDDDQLAVLSRLGEGWFKGGSEILRKCFKLRGGKLHSARLDRERKKQAEWRAKSSAGGIKSGLTRRSTSKGGSVLVEPNANRPVEPNANSSSSSSTLYLKEGNGEADDAKQQVGRRNAPTLDMCRLYGDKIGLPASESEKFWNHHEARGWMLGRVAMRSWRHAMVTWRINWQEWDRSNGNGSMPAINLKRPALSLEEELQRKRREWDAFGLITIAKARGENDERKPTEPK